MSQPMAFTSVMIPKRKKPSMVLQRKDQVLFGDEYDYLENLSVLNANHPTVVAVQSYEGIPFNDSSSRIDITLEQTDDLLQIARYTQTHISNITPLREKMTVYSEKKQ